MLTRNTADSGVAELNVWLLWLTSGDFNATDSANNLGANLRCGVLIMWLPSPTLVASARVDPLIRSPVICVISVDEAYSCKGLGVDAFFHSLRLHTGSTCFDINWAADKPTQAVARLDSAVAIWIFDTNC